MTAAWMLPVLGSGLERGEIWNAVVALAGQAIPLRTPGASFAFTLSAPPAPDAWVVAVGIDDRPASILVHVRAFPFRAMFDVDLDVADLPGLPEGLRQALFEGMFATVRTLVAPEGRRLVLEAQGIPSAFPEFAATDVQWFDVRIARPDGLAIELDVACDRSVVTELLPNALAVDAPARVALARTIMVAADITIGAITIRHADLAALEPGAVVVMAEQPEGSLAIRVQDAVFDFARAEKGWRSAGPRSIGRYRSRATLHKADRGNAMNDEANAGGQGDPEAPLAVADLRIAIDFDIGRSMIPFSVLSQWQPGMVVNFDPPAVGEGLEVTIRANGEAIGTGDIVRIDDRIAVRITRFLLRS